MSPAHCLGMEAVMAQEVDLERLMRAHQADIWRFLRALGCDAALADDLTQETFLSLYRSDFDEVNAASTLAWLRKAARNFFLGAMRKGKVRALVANLKDVDVAWSDFAGDDGVQHKVEALKRCMEGLDDRARAALQWRYGHDVGRAELASKLGLSEGGAKNLLERVKKNLRECVQRRLGHDF